MILTDPDKPYKTILMYFFYFFLFHSRFPLFLLFLLRQVLRCLVMLAVTAFQTVIWVIVVSSWMTMTVSSAKAICYTLCLSHYLPVAIALFLRVFLNNAFSFNVTVSRYTSWAYDCHCLSCCCSPSFLSFFSSSSFYLLLLIIIIVMSSHQSCSL